MGKDKGKIKVVFLGEQSTGKTSILSRFIEDKFEVGLATTVGIDFMAKTFIVAGKAFRLQFWDTAGQERFRSLIPNYLKQAVIAFLVFDVSNEKSFANLPEWIDLCNQNMPQNSIMILLGNKSDLKDERQVEEQDAMKIAASYKLKYFEVSAKTGDNIKQSLNFACQQLLQMNSKIERDKFSKTVEIVELDKNKTNFNSQNFSLSLNEKKQITTSTSRCC